MSETKTVAVATRNDAFIAFRKLHTGSVGRDAVFLIRLFGAKAWSELPDRQLGEFIRLCELGMQSTTLEELKQSIRADAGPAEPTYEDVLDAAAALRRRINEDAARYLCRSFGHNDPSGLRRYANPVPQFREFIRLSRLPASTSEEFALALADTVDDNWSREARAPLPDDLRVLALEYRRSGDLAENIEMLSDVLNQIGCFSKHKPNEITIFGKEKSERSEIVRIRVDVIARQSDLENWLSAPEEVQRRFGFGWHGDLWLCREYKVLNSFAHRYELGDEQADVDLFWSRGILKDEDIDPDEPGQLTKWARSAVLTEPQLERFMHLRAACNGKIDEMKKVLDRQQYRAGPQQFLVEGLIPKSVPVLLLAKQKVGKTNAMLELAVAVARRESQWLGFPLKSGHGFAVYLFGEGSREDAEERVRTMNGGELPLLLNLVPYDGTEIDEILKSLSGVNIELLIVDPARKFYKGDEDGSDAVSEFFTKLEEFGRRKHAAIVVTHHLKREAAPKTIHDVPRCMRGSQVFLDRPRVVLAMRRAGLETQFGIPAPDGQRLHNFRGSSMFSGIRRLRRDEASFRHVVLGTIEGKGFVATGSAETNTDDSELIPVEIGLNDLERIRAAVVSLINGGQRVTSRGKRELFVLKPLDGISRAATRAAIERLESDGVLRRDGSGTLALPE